jgi:hypothetical protein
VIDLDSYDELMCRYASMTKIFEKKLAKTMKLKNKNSFVHMRS